MVSGGGGPSLVSATVLIKRGTLFTAEDTQRLFITLEDYVLKLYDDNSEEISSGGLIYKEVGIGTTIISNNVATPLTYLPPLPSLGDTVRIVGAGVIWKVKVLNDYIYGQTINMGSLSVDGLGYVQCNGAYDTAEFTFTREGVYNNPIWVVTSLVGTLSFVPAETAP